MQVSALIPPFRFNIVELFVYRGSYPTLKNFRFLKHLKLQTLISVTPESTSADVLEFCKEEEITHYHFFAEKYSSDNVTVSPAIATQIVQILIEPSHFPIYIHCLDGSNVTGIVIMILRKLQNWTKVATISEFCRFTRDHSIEKNESEYLAAVSEEIVIPSKIPGWLWGGQRIHKHPTLSIRQTDHNGCTSDPNDVLINTQG